MTNQVLLSIEQLAALGGRLAKLAAHIERTIAPITEWELYETVSYLEHAHRDIMLVVALCDRMASLRFDIAQLAQKVLEHPEWDSAAVARDIRALLEDRQEMPQTSRASHYSG